MSSLSIDEVPEAPEPLFSSEDAILPAVPEPEHSDGGDTETSTSEHDPDTLKARPADVRGVLAHSPHLTRACAKVFLEALARTGIVTEACKAGRISRRQVYRLRQNDPAFAELWTEAQLIAADLLEAEAHRRAFDGVLKPVYQKGEQVGVIREYSDKLMELLLKARKPETFKERKEVEHKGSVVHFNITGVARHAPNARPIDVEAEEHPANGGSDTDSETA